MSNDNHQDIAILYEAIAETHRMLRDIIASMHTNKIMIEFLIHEAQQHDDDLAQRAIAFSEQRLGKSPLSPEEIEAVLELPSLPIDDHAHIEVLRERSRDIIRSKILRMFNS